MYLKYLALEMSISIVYGMVKNIVYIFCILSLVAEACRNLVDESPAFVLTFLVKRTNIILTHFKLGGDGTNGILIRFLTH